MKSNLALVFGAASAVALLLAGCRTDPAAPSDGPSPSAARPTTASGSSVVEASPPAHDDTSQPAGVVDSWLDPSTWKTYVSDRYQFTIGHPEDWTVIESGHRWDQATDSINNDSGALEVFVPPDDTISIYMAAWAVDVDRRTTLVEWAQGFCDRHVASCTEVMAMSEAASVTANELEGILLTWDDGMIAFYPTWYDDTGGRTIWEQQAPGNGRIYIVESGRPANGPYHARELMEAFSTSLCGGCEG